MRNDALWLSVMLELKRAPVGIRFLYDKSEYDSCPTPELSGPLPYCAAVKNAASGIPCKLSLEQTACLSGARALGLLKPEDDIVNPNDILSGKRHHKMGLYADYAISRQIAKDMVYCDHHVYGIEIAELALYTDYNPDLVIVIANAANAMRLIQGYSYHYGQLKNVKITGNQAICQECTSYPFEMNQVNISLLCSGTRQVSKWDDDEMGIGIPFNQLDKIVDGIRQTSNPMDNNKTKKSIKSKAEKHGVEEQVDIQLGSNYYTGGYGTIEYHKRKQANNQK
ncbi:hypothetical protein SOASR030_00100 [Leminorella grimontii]|uniref:Uncharacterized protein n=1 Tax=Leminorella grimontii TaxID=82981 RepID=A0AAV5MXB7_9GAMM|nr:DUF169 domain-containing protein [Leminorella grimontii]KFC95528.1 hypothetical protein GLGR_2070 [Leminorella grimontii ATCC 33999 = DSM 5078]GKX53898.1 hypothetical protein SOASR030_00100 [Leminorella grimontii]GKX60355.1 hypothetical protein SOASR031_26700 [Leminorella grimontii]VFS60634.1 Uncharacterised ArCR, COG2043 [Leminorella grimontii]